MTRTAKLATLPLSIAGRAAIGAGKRLGGASADVVNAALAERTAEQLFTVLGELKGGAMKVGQAMSVLEAGLPEELAKPYREALTRLQDAAPPLPPESVHRVLTTELGSRWRTKFTSFDDVPAAAASVGQVHQAVWKDGRRVAVKIQYPGAGPALISDVKQLSRVARLSSGLTPGIDMEPLLQRLLERVSDELDYELEARRQVAFGEAFADDPRFYVPAVVHRRGTVLVTEWIDGTPLSRIISEGDEQQRAHAAELFVEFLISSPQRVGLLHADPHPGNYRILPDGRLGVLDFGSVDVLPHGLPPAIGALLRAALNGDAETLRAGLIDEGFLRADTKVPADEVLEFVQPYLECLRPEVYTFTRAWLREQFARFRDPRASAWRTTAHFNLPPDYLFIERVYASGVGVLCQLGAPIRGRAIMERWLPGFAEPPEPGQPQQPPQP